MFPKDADVVLLAGLAGDAESEAAYREQLQTWVDLASSAGQTRRVFALGDVPEAIRLPSGAKVTTLGNDRRTFLELPGRLGQVTNTLVVIAWGHGGRQRDVPVLHVRGPRLTPDDFAALSASATDSQWLLLFRGSGAFARRLAGPRARVLSSDAGQAFTSDPVAMPLLLKLARGEAANSFETLGRELGLATASWYAERGLARTEDPALWTDSDNPQQLANADAALKPEAGDNAAPKPGKVTASGTAESEEEKESGRGFERAGVWKSIKRVEAGVFAGFDAVVLNQRLVCSLGTNPALATEQEEFIQVLAPEGKAYGDFDVSFSPPQEEIEFQDLELLGPDGKLVRLDPDRVGESPEQAPGDYQGQRRKFFSLPGVVPGAIVHVRYRTQWKQFPLPQISMALPLGKPIPTLVSRVQISLPKQSAFHWVLEQMPPSAPEVRQTAYAATYTWSFTNVPAHGTEVLSAPLQVPRLLFSTFRDWADFAGWYERISRLTAEVTPELEAKAKALTAESRTDEEKLAVLYNYVTALRYVAVPLGINSVRPHAAATVLKNQFGDCKDKANLLNTLLRAVGIESHLVLVPRFSQAHEAVPGLAFNHAISRVRLGEQLFWLDTTDDLCRFRLLPPGDCGRKVLVIDGQTSALVHLPAADPGDHRLRIEGRLRWLAPGASLPAVLKVVGAGYPDYELRNSAREAREHRSALPLLSASYRPIAGAFALRKQVSTPVSALDRDFSWEAEGECLGLSLPSGGTNYPAMVQAPFWIPRQWDLALHQRRSPLFLNQGYPVTLDQRFQIQLPGKARSVTVPAACENTEGPLRWRLEWARIGDDKLEAHLKVEQLLGELSSAETPVFQKELAELLGALTGVASVSW